MNAWTEILDNDLGQNVTAEQGKSLLGTLTVREEIVIKMRFGLDGRGKHTHKEIGDWIALSRSRIQQIEVKALAKLRHPSRLRMLDSQKKKGGK
jgi:RNA polymerase primary sigma factor